MTSNAYHSSATDLQQTVKVPSLVWGKALHQHADLAGDVWLELQITDFQVVQKLPG